MKDRYWERTASCQTRTGCFGFTTINPVVVYIVASCIVGNFLVNVVEKEIDADQHTLKYETVWGICDLVFNCIFVVELVLNMWGYGGPVREFWRSG